QNNEGAIRREMIEQDAIECMVALPSQLFFNTQIPACLWFLNKDKKANGRDCTGEILFIDARKLGRLENRVNRVFDDSDIQKIADTYHAWKQTGETEKQYEDVLGFCKSAKLEEVRSHDYILTPGRYVGAEAVEDDDDVFTEKMSRLTIELAAQFAESAKLEREIKQNLASIGLSVKIDLEV
ncbi:MAG: N-6 DNA methylase, partial [Pyrinomonadaceae bacterium]